MLRGIGEAERVTVSLLDQFGFEPEVVAAGPSLLCNPIKKGHGGETTPIGKPLDHLVCYELENTEQFVPLAHIRNQLGERDLLLDQADLPCLSSQRRVIEQPQR